MINIDPGSVISHFCQSLTTVINIHPDNHDHNEHCEYLLQAGGQHPTRLRWSSRQSTESKTQIGLSWTSTQANWLIQRKLMIQWHWACVPSLNTLVVYSNHHCCALMGAQAAGEKVDLWEGQKQLSSEGGFFKWLVLDKCKEFQLTCAVVPWDDCDEEYPALPVWLVVLEFLVCPSSPGMSAMWKSGIVQQGFQSKISITVFMWNVYLPLSVYDEH